MTQEEAKTLHHKWKANGGGKPCLHSLLELETKPGGGQIPGSYFCVFCGLQIAKVQST